MKTAILTDSGCGLTPQQAKEYGIYLVPLQVIDENVSYRWLRYDNRRFI